MGSKLQNYREFATYNSFVFYLGLLVRLKIAWVNTKYNMGKTMSVFTETYHSSCPFLRKTHSMHLAYRVFRHKLYINNINLCFQPQI